MCEKTKPLGQLMRNVRKAKKLSVREVSELTGIHPGAIIKFELNQTDMTISRVFKLCEVLGFSLAEISPENINKTDKKQSMLNAIAIFTDLFYNKFNDKKKIEKRILTLCDVFGFLEDEE